VTYDGDPQFQQIPSTDVALSGADAVQGAWQVLVHSAHAAAMAHACRGLHFLFLDVGD
jgi:hypothetical protein